MTGPLIAIVDYGMGNRRSVQKALEHVGTRVVVSSEAETLLAADGLVVPGVGAFPQAMHNLRELGLIELLRDRAALRTPILGICLGMQLLFERSEELGGAEGLGLVGGAVTGIQTGGLRIPHIGWNEVRFERSSALTRGLPPEGCPFYHVHSFAARPTDPRSVLGSTEYGERFATIIEHGTVSGVQFHPEKSSARGLTMLRNFAALCGPLGPAERPAAERPAAARA